MALINVSFRGKAHGQAARQRRGAADRGEYREAVGLR